jgi:hypothetical protein
LFPWPAVKICLAAIAVIAPFWVVGNPSGHDFEFHMFSWMEVVSQWKQAILYPRWAALAHWGYGEARFIFYPPFSWHLGALLGLMLPWKAVPGAFIWVALVASGTSMYMLVRRWFSRSDAIFAAALYAANPYHIVIVYWRSAMAELLASCLLPLLVLFLLEAVEGKRRATVGLGLVIAAAWLTNEPSAVMVNYSVAFIACLLAIRQRSYRVLLRAGVAVLLGGLLAAFYLFPAAYEQKWVNIVDVLSPGVRPQDNFFFTVAGNSIPESVAHTKFNFLVSTVAVSEIAVFALAAFLARRFRKEQTTAWWVLAAWGCVLVLFMSRLTQMFWEYMPKLRYVQLPWRFLLCFNVPFAILSAAGLRRWWSRLSMYAVMLAVLAGVWLRIQPPWWDTSADINEMQDMMTSDGGGYEGTDEYVPRGADPYEVNQNEDEVVAENGAPVKVDIDDWGPQLKTFSVNADQNVTLRLRLFNYPAWRVEVNGAPVRAGTANVTGQMRIPIRAGPQHVVVKFVRTWDRTFGGLISMLAVALVSGWIWRNRADWRVAGASP